MGKIIVWNTHGNDDYSQKENNFYIGRSSRHNSPLANPFTYTGKRSNLAKLSFPTSEQAIKAYELYFDELYGKPNDLTKEFNRIYEKYKKGEDVYLQCFCSPEPCHGDVIARKLQARLLKENLKNGGKEKVDKMP